MRKILLGLLFVCMATPSIADSRAYGEPAEDTAIGISVQFLTGGNSVDVTGGVTISGPVTLGAPVTMGAPVTVGSSVLPTGAAEEATLVAVEADTTVIAGDTTSIDAKIPALGQAAMAASMPVVIASDQSPIEMEGTAATGAAVSGNPVLMGGKDGLGNARPILVSATTGRLMVVKADNVIDAKAVTVTFFPHDESDDLEDTHPLGVLGYLHDSAGGPALRTMKGNNQGLFVQGAVAGGVTVNLGSNNDVTVAGVATAANQATEITSLGNIDTNTTGLAGTVSGSEQQVDIVAPLPAGTNAIGKLAANTGVDIGDVDVISAPARVDTTDSIKATTSTDGLTQGTTVVSVNFADIDVAASGDNTLIAAVAGKKARILSLLLVASAAVNARFEDGAAGAALSGQMNLTTNSGFVLPYNPLGWFETTANTLLNLELSGATSVDGLLTYILVD